MDELARRRVPPSLAEHLERGFGQVSPAARQVAAVGSLTGRRWVAAEIATLLGWSAATVRYAGEELAGSWLVDDDGSGSYTFRHESFQRYAARFVAPAERRAYRRRWVDVRLAGGARPVEVVSVLAAVAEPGDEAAVTILATAARELGENTPSQAGDLYLRALDLDRTDTPERAQLAAEAAVVLWAAQRGDDGSAVSDSSLRGFADAAAEAQARYELALRLADYTSAETIRQCRLALALNGIPADVRARLLSLLIGALYTADVYEDVPELQAPARAAADETGDVDAHLTTLDSGSVVAYYAGDVEGALAAMDEADALRALNHRPAPTNAPYDLWPPVLLRSVGRSSAGFARAARETRNAYASGRGLAMLRWGALRAELQYDAGRLLEARAEADGLREFAEVVDPDGFAGDLIARVRARVAIHLGEPAEVEAARRAVETRLLSERRWQRATALMDGLLLADHVGDAGQLADLVRLGVENREPEGLRFVAGSDSVDELNFARLALRAGEPEIAADILETLRFLDRRNPRLPFLHGLALHLTGLTTRDPRPIAEAAELHYATADNVLVRAVAYEDAAALTRPGEPGEGAEFLRRALRIHETARARNSAARVRAGLAALGVTGPPAAPLPPDVETVAARLVAEGLSTQAIADHLDLPPHTTRALLRRAKGHC